MTRARRVAQISVLLIEDNRLLREGISAALASQPDFSVRATPPPREKVLRQVREAPPHVALLDSALGDQDSLRLLAGIRKASPATRVIVMGLLPAPQDVVEFIEGGAAGFVMKDATIAEFHATIRAVANGASVLPSMLTATIFSHVAEHAERHPPSARRAGAMTRRERQVVGLLGKGLSNKEIAARLGIGLHTVKSHVHNVLDKLALHSRLQVAAYSHQESEAGS
ncbi:MAG TPA: response regulator transcription factor [Gemmatimonadales bacterium]